MRLIQLVNTITVLFVVLKANLIYADAPYNLDLMNPSRPRDTVRAKIEEICRKLNDPRLDTNEKRVTLAREISSTYPYRADKVYIYSRRIKGVVLEAKIRIPFLYRMEVKKDPFGGIGKSLRENAIYLYTIEVDYDVPPDDNFDCDSNPPEKKIKGKNIPALSRTIDAAFDALDKGSPKRVETAPFPSIPRIAVTIRNIRP